MLWAIGGGLVLGLVAFCALAWVVGLFAAGAGMPERPDDAGCSSGFIGAALVYGWLAGG
jgi:hypothetical protein